MKIVCDACSAKYSIADEKVRGKVFKIRCKKCSNIIVVRGVAEEAEAPAPGFDHKETHVFNYGNYEDGGNETVQGAAEEAAWHVVIDQEQIGPMTAAEVRDRFARGEIDSETYTWREGFDDWERLASLDAFSDLFAGGAGAAAPAASDDGMAGLFGGPAVEDTAAAQSDPADLFTAQTGVGDVIGDGGAVADPAQPAAAAAGAPMADSLFGGGSQPAAGAGAAAAGGDLQIASQLTGQRSENSVLFSLNNLASLASDSPKQPSSPQPTSSASSGSGGVTEGSGLIDIRSMASVYLGEQRSASPAQASGSADDLPMFSSGSFDAASPVLLPSTSPSASNNRLIYILMAVIGVLVLAATILVVYVVKNSGSAKTAIASTTPESASTKPASAAGTAAAAGSPAGKSAPGAAAQSGTAATAVDPGAAAAAKQAQPKSAGNGGSAAAPAAASHDSSSRDHHHDHARSHSRHDRHTTRTHSRAASPSPAPASKPASGGGCDEVTCLVSPNKPCCRKYHGGGSSGSSHHASSSNSNLPKSLSRDDVISGIGRVTGRVSSCGSRYNGHGEVMAHIHISSSGRVSGVSVSGASGSLASCVKSAIRHAHFKRTQSGMSVNYPFVFH